MTDQLNVLRRDFIEKVEHLEEVKSILKSEFVGIDNVIEDIVDNVRSWYTMSSIQERPAVINLWGLTGVGKTSLVLRLMELINFDDKTYRLDLGEKDGRMSFRSVLEDLCDNKDDSPIVIILDEFQHARTIKGVGPMREEVDNDHNRMVWELIDSGTIMDHQWKFGIWAFERLLNKLEQLVLKGVTVENGVVIDGIDIYKKEFKVDQEDNKPIYFYPEEEYGKILSLSDDGNRLWTDVQEKFLQMDEGDTIQFMKDTFKRAKRPSKKSFSKALIFAIGNIDEAYTMSSNYSSEISADEFHQQSLKITLPEMKEALRTRFRDEQIARLGNTHIIYPALSRSAYQAFIDQQLDKLAQKMTKQFGIQMSFAPEVKDILYKEGVYPTQGVRPLITTIQTVINSRISIYLNRILKNNLNTDHLHLYLEDELQLACGFYENEQLKFTYTDTLHLNLESLRRSKNDEMQAIAAVHESGHAVLSSVLLHVIPDLVVSVTSDADAAGFVYSKHSRDYFAKYEIVPKAAVHLGGIIAEELIFGEDYVTAGASTDLMNATSFIMRMLKKHGMGSKKINFAKSHAEETMTFHDTSDIEEEALQLLEKAKELALVTLQKEKHLLLVLSEILSSRTRMEKEELYELILEHATSYIPNNEESTLYRDKLKARLETEKISKELKKMYPIQMNKNKA